jgi:hypothetical protein
MDHPFITRWIEDVAKSFAAKIDKQIWEAIKGDKPMDHILKNICLVNLNVSLWAGRKSMKPADLAAGGIDISKLPPGSLASLGSKKTIDPEATSPFTKLKNKAIKTCLEFGIRFGTCGYAIPEDKIQDIAIQLAEIKRQFAKEKIDFLASYQTDTENWINKNPVAWQPIISNCVDDVGDVSSALEFNFSVFRVNAPEDTENGLADEVGGLHAQLCKEVRDAAKVAFTTSYAGKKEIGQRALRPIKTIKDKLTALAFLDADIPNLVDMIDANLRTVGKKSVISGTDLQMLSGLIANNLMNLGKKTVYEEAEDLLIEPETEEVVDAEPPAKPIDSVLWDF